MDVIMVWSDDRRLARCFVVKEGRKEEGRIAVRGCEGASVPKCWKERCDGSVRAVSAVCSGSG
ncbi:hypothetical protein NEUTE1DRAFT_117363, partial [Neurospora tetrasperma FGSC 2508]